MFSLSPVLQILAPIIDYWSGGGLARIVVARRSPSTKLAFYLALFVILHGVSQSATAVCWRHHRVSSRRCTQPGRDVRRTIHYEKPRRQCGAELLLPDYLSAAFDTVECRSQYFVPTSGTVMDHFLLVTSPRSSVVVACMDHYLSS